MDIAVKIFKFLFRNKWWLIIFPILAFFLAFHFTKNYQRTYTSNTVIYTGVISGYNLESSLSSRVDLVQSNNQMENFLNIIRSYTTLKNVSLMLYAQHMMYGDTLKDTKYILSKNFRQIYYHAPKEVRALINKNSFDTTLMNLQAYDKNDQDNYLYGLFMWNFKYYGKETLEKISVSRLNASDMLEIKYSNDDPYVVYNTLEFLNQEFLEQYSIMRDDQADKAIAYFEAELERIDGLLKTAEEEQKQYSITNRVINYDEQTKQMAFIQSSYKIKVQECQLALSSSLKIIQDMEKRFGKNFDSIKNNEEFLQKLKKVSSLSNQISINTIFQDTSIGDSISNASSHYALQRDLDRSENDLMSYIDQYFLFTGSGEVLISKDVAYSWLQATIQHEKAKEELMVLKDIEDDITQMFVDYSPIGVSLKQQERMISFLEDEYLSALDNLNQAKLRKNNNRMSVANLKIITPPQLPLNPEPSKRVYLVVAAGLGTFVFILGVLILIELLGKTLRDKYRAERLTKGKVICAMPRKAGFTNRKYQDDFWEAAIKHLSNSILNKVRYKELNIVNIISFTPYMGKTEVCEHLAAIWNNVGRKYRIVNWKETFNRNDREIMYPINLNDVLALGTDRIVLIEHRDISNEIIQQEILQKAVINILLLDATTSWKDTDIIYYQNLLELIKSNNIFICLMNADRYVVEDFTGQLPPYNFLTNLSHDIYNFGTSTRTRK